MLPTRYGKRAWNSFHGSGGFGKRSVDDQVEEEGTVIQLIIAFGVPIFTLVCMNA